MTPAAEYEEFPIELWRAELKKEAARVLEREREACAGILDAVKGPGAYLEDLADQIRARGNRGHRRGNRKNSPRH